MTTPSPALRLPIHARPPPHADTCPLTPRLQTTRNLSRCSRTTSSPLPSSTVTPPCAAVGQPYACPLHPTAQNEAPRTRCQFAQADLGPRPRRHRPTVRWMRWRVASMARPPATVVTSARGIRTARLGLRPWSRRSRHEGDRAWPSTLFSGEGPPRSGGRTCREGHIDSRHTPILSPSDTDRSLTAEG